MKAIILSAGRGTRLLPHTAAMPKCLLTVRGEQTVLDVQLRTLSACGVTRAIVMTGFRSDLVAAHLARRPVPGIATTVHRNPRYAEADNFVTCWQARSEMDGDFILLNGDTLFEARVLERLLASQDAPAALAACPLDAFDEDDMKAIVDRSGRLVSVGKTLDPDLANAESIGLMVFRGVGPRLFRRALRSTAQEPGADGAFYLVAVNRFARSHPIATVWASDLWWQEIDTFDDWVRARVALARLQCPLPQSEARHPDTPDHGTRDSGVEHANRSAQQSSSW